jgi:hypothetical protein
MAPYRHAPARRQLDAKAVLSLVLGLASFVFGPATGIPAIILGSVSRRDIDRSGGRYEGALLARSGTLAGFFGVGFFVVFVLWIGSALVTTPTDAAQLKAMNEEAQAHAKVVKTTPPSPHPRGDVEVFHSIH